MLETGLPYDAYLAEIRSIGGLSGSPVFVFIGSGRAYPRNLMGSKIFLLGLIRGHWDYKKKMEAIDFGDNELEAVNMGVATVTPIREVLTILNSPELVRERRQRREQKIG